MRGEEMDKSTIIESTVKIRVFGAFETNFTRDQFKPHVTEEEIKMYNRFWYPSEYAPYVGLNDVFIITNAIITPTQILSTCPRDPKDYGVLCDPLNNFCGIDPVENSSYRKPPLKFKYTGRCVPTVTVEGSKTHACEIKSWCPSMRADDLALKNNTALLRGASESILVITNNILFPTFGYSARNKKIKKRADCIKNQSCADYKVDEIVRAVSDNQSYENTYRYGAVLSVGIHWDCNIRTIWQASMNFKYRKPLLIFETY